MHCAVGIARVKTWRIGWPLSPTEAWFVSTGADGVPTARHGAHDELEVEVVAVEVERQERPPTG